MDFLNEQDPKKAFKKLKEELLSSKGRWLFSFFNMLTIGIIIYLFISNDQPETYFPIILKGKAAWTVLWAALATWSILSIYSWINWIKNK